MARKAEQGALATSTVARRDEVRAPRRRAPANIRLKRALAAGEAVTEGDVCICDGTMEGDDDFCLWETTPTADEGIETLIELTIEQQHPCGGEDCYAEISFDWEVLGRCFKRTGRPGAYVYRRGRHIAYSFRRDCVLLV